MPRRFANRRQAGSRLADELARFAGVENLLILALPRGGVPVAAEIAAALDKPFDVLVVRKLGVPGHEEVAMGAIAAGGLRVLSHDLIHRLGISPWEVDEVLRREFREIDRREQLYRKGRPMPDVRGRTVIVVDDGIATGSTMSAAVALLRHFHAKRIVVAAPVAPDETVERLQDEADEVVVLMRPDPFRAVGEWYDDFSQTSDEEVGRLLDMVSEVQEAAASWAIGASPDEVVLRHLRERLMPLCGSNDDYDGLLGMIGDARLVLLGEASHGSHEFYHERAKITKRLITEKGFNAIAIEGDWPDAYRVNRFVRGEPGDVSGERALAGFERFPSWMWRNADVLDFIGWMREYNERIGDTTSQVGFYGLDLYSLHKSIHEILSYLERRDPGEAAKARHLYGCLEQHGKDPQMYGMMVASGMASGCREEVARQLADLSCKQADLLLRNGQAAADEFFFAEQNARLVKNAEQYYRLMFRSDISSWNLRDSHMMETLVSLLSHLKSRGSVGKVVVWAHNSHIGDARATQMGDSGEWNIGQLVRERFPGESRLIGFTTCSGTVTAAAGWHLPARRRHVLPSLPGSFEKLFHDTGCPRFWIDLTHGNEATEALGEERLERAIGVVYHPENERRSHYFGAKLSSQFDAVIHFDQTRAVEPLERDEVWDATESPETYPIGL